MINRGFFFYGFLWLIITGFCASGAIFANTSVPTTIHILPPPYEISYDPPHSSGTYTTGFVYVSITGDGIRENISGVRDNGTYDFIFYRGTGPFTTGAGYSSGNTRTRMMTGITIDWIDNEPPKFDGVIDGETYDHSVSITFTDNLPGVSATINGKPFTNGSSISTNGTYQLIVTDAVGNTTGATFIIYLLATPPPSNGGGGGSSLGYRILTHLACQNRTCYSTYYDDLCGPCTLAEQEETAIPPLPRDWPPYHYANPQMPNIKFSSYPQERIDTYKRAYRLGITTVADINNAELEGVLYRKFAAKMASEFAIKVIGLKPDKDKKCEFTDIAKEELELQYYIQLACQLGIMGLDYYGEPDTTFNPNYVVTRDQLVTILSRILFGQKFNLRHNEFSFFDKVRNFAVHTLNNASEAMRLNIRLYTPLDRYTKHLNAIRKLGIMTDYTLSLKEFRIYVMIIMRKIDEMGIKKIQNLVQ